MTTITIDRSVVEQALEAFEAFLSDELRPYEAAKTAANIRAAMAQQAEPKGGGRLPLPLQAEPVAWRCACGANLYLDEYGHPASRAYPRQPAPEPMARECSDPMCACRGGPCAECEEGQREKEIEDLRSSLDFYQRRCEALQSWQSKMRDPERTIVCDILANGFTLDPAFAGNRYTAPPKAEPVEPVAWLVMDESGYVQHAASWRDAAHEHINDAINEHDLVCARTWRVVPVYTAPPRPSASR